MTRSILHTKVWSFAARFPAGLLPHGHLPRRDADDTALEVKDAMRELIAVPGPDQERKVE